MIKPACCLLLLATPLVVTLPHDTWLLFLDGDGRGASLSLRTGMDFPQSLNAVAAENIRAQLRDPAGAVRDVGGWRADETTQSSVAALGELKAGVHVAWASTEPKLIKMEARKFNDYLLHDGLPHVLAARMDAAEEGKAAVEQYRKCAKVVFAVGGALDGAFDRPTGQRLEIVPLDHPLKVRPRETMAVRVLWQGKPLVRANLCWDHAGNGEDFTGCTWTDAAGEALVPIARAGAMTLRLVHMERPKAADHEWASCWASLTFTVSAR